MRRPTAQEKRLLQMHCARQSFVRGSGWREPEESIPAGTAARWRGIRCTSARASGVGEAKEIVAREGVEPHRPRGLRLRSADGRCLGHRYGLRMRAAARRGERQRQRDRTAARSMAPDLSDSSRPCPEAPPTAPPSLTHASRASASVMCSTSMPTPVLTRSASRRKGARPDLGADHRDIGRDLTESRGDRVRNLRIHVVRYTHANGCGGAVVRACSRPEGQAGRCISANRSSGRPRRPPDSSPDRGPALGRR
jgi:hypothetical protein